MDPEVRQPEPGACPKCGMALEPELAAAPVTKTEWTCPMHPEIVRDAPGSCPICGMTLEPRTVEVEEAPNPELVDMSRRFRTSAALALPLLIIAMHDFIPGQPIASVVPARRAMQIDPIGPGELGRAYLNHARAVLLDVGTATGFLTFHMERHGAEVISYDLSPAYRWDLVPVAGIDWRRQLPH